MHITCIGCGVMASAFAIAQGSKHTMSMIPSAYDEEIVDCIKDSQFDPRLACPWPESIKFVETPTQCDLLVIGVSSMGVDWAKSVALTLMEKHRVPVLLLTKGLIEDHHGFLLLTEYFSKALQTEVLAITGPCIAKELAHQKPTAVEISGHTTSLSVSLSQALSLPFYHVYPNQDTKGCQLLAALKNVYAIHVGMAVDMNERAYRFSQSIQEMGVLVEQLGGDPSTASGLSGLGDLYVTVQGGRNGKFGGYLASGMRPEEILSGPMQGVTVEGYDVLQLLQRTNVQFDQSRLQALSALLTLMS